jgi:hypothetical protein
MTKIAARPQDTDGTIDTVQYLSAKSTSEVQVDTIEDE